MKKLSILLAVVVMLLPAMQSLAGSYTAKLCKDPRFKCKKVYWGQRWSSFARHPAKLYALMRLNRINVELRPGMRIAVPRGRYPTGPMAFRPFVKHIKARGHKVVVFDPSVLAWGAYDANGSLVRWGPAVGGMGYCHDIGENCRTKSGNFKIFRKKGIDCISKTFPIEENGGAPMPYCMFFNGGIAMHGGILPGQHASHGCVRLFTEDARWLNEEFTRHGTRVIVMPYRSV